MPQVNEHIARVNVANARIANLYVEWARQCGLPYNRFLVLYALLEGGPQPQRSIVRRTHLIKQTVSNLVAALVEDGMAEVRTTGQDRRQRVVALTQAGEAYAHEVADELLRMEQEAVDRMGEQKAAMLAQLSEAFGNALQAVMAESAKRE